MHGATIGTSFRISILFLGIHIKQSGFVGGSSVPSVVLRDS